MYVFCLTSITRHSGHEVTQAVVECIHSLFHYVARPHLVQLSVPSSKDINFVPGYTCAYHCGTRLFFFPSGRFLETEALSCAVTACLAS